MVIVAGDFNELLDTSHNGMTRLCHECCLVDPMVHKHGHIDFTTYHQGNKILDYILVDPLLSPLIDFTGYNHIISDHQGVYIDIDMA